MSDAKDPKPTKKTGAKPPKNDDTNLKNSSDTSQTIENKTPAATKEPSADKEPSANKQPSASNEKPSSKQNPSVDKGSSIEKNASEKSSALDSAHPSDNDTPSSNNKSLADKSPLVDKEPLANNEEPLANNEEPSANKEPSASNEKLSASNQNESSSTAAGGVSKTSKSPQADSQQQDNPGAGIKAKLVWLALALLTLLILIFAAGLAYWTWSLDEKHQQQTQALINRLANEEQSVSELKNELQGHKQALSSESQKQIEGLKKQFEQLNTEARGSLQSQGELVSGQNKKLAQMGQRLDGQQQRLLTLSTTNREDWLLAEAEYLMRLANQRVLIEREPYNAIALLEASDKIIVQVSEGLGDPELHGIRETIARELTSLKLIAGIDKEGVYLRIQALVDQVDKLPRVPESPFKQDVSKNINGAEVENKESTEQLSWWQKIKEQFKQTLGGLDNYIRINPRQAPVQPLVDQYAAQVAGLNVRLLLQQAQIALLKEQGDLYQQSLNEAQMLVQRYYSDSSIAQEYRRAIDDLESLDVAPELPDISNSLKLLHGYIRQIHLMNPEGDQP